MVAFDCSQWACQFVVFNSFEWQYQNKSLILDVFTQVVCSIQVELYRMKGVNSFEFDIEMKHISQCRHINCFRSNYVLRMGIHRLQFTPNFNQSSNVNDICIRDNFIINSFKQMQQFSKHWKSLLFDQLSNWMLWSLNANIRKPAILHIYLNKSNHLFVEVAFNKDIVTWFVFGTFIIYWCWLAFLNRKFEK